MWSALIIKSNKYLRVRVARHHEAIDLHLCIRQGSNLVLVVDKLALVSVAAVAWGSLVPLLAHLGLIVPVG